MCHSKYRNGTKTVDIQYMACSGEHSKNATPSLVGRAIGRLTARKTGQEEMCVDINAYQETRMESAFLEGR
jgi:hypothetical protein